MSEVDGLRDLIVEMLPEHTLGSPTGPHPVDALIAAVRAEPPTDAQIEAAARAICRPSNDGSAVWPCGYCKKVASKAVTAALAAREEAG